MASLRVKHALSSEQEELYKNAVELRKNIFYTGSGGTGKSYITSLIISKLRDKLGDNAVGVTASTGRAAFNIGGITLHKFAGVGLAKESKNTLLSKVRKNRNTSTRWLDTQVLIVDEVSMITGELFDKLEFIARSLKKNNLPFGGIQLLLVGDLLQLPPVMQGDELRIFQASSWESCIQDYVCLKVVHRQKENEFIDALSRIRIGLVDDKVLSFIEKVSRPVEYPEDLLPVNIYSIRSKADRFNNATLNKIKGQHQRYVAVDSSTASMGTEPRESDCPAPETLDLKIGAQVMLIRNLTSKLTNGTIGVVTRYISLPDDSADPHTNNTIPVVAFVLADGSLHTRAISYEVWESRYPNHRLRYSRKQLPLILAWAVTVHKSQGQTIQRLRVDLDDVFEAGQVYTALSRAVSIETLEVLNFNPHKVKADAIALEFCMKKDLL